MRDVGDLIRQLRPDKPVYCIYPHVYRDAIDEFVSGFPGSVMYAVKANNDEQILSLFGKFGIRHFDCASLDEIELVRRTNPSANCYYMNPARIAGDARRAQQAYQTRHFVIDHMDGLRQLVREIDAGGAVIFARMAVHHTSAMEDLSQKFGAPPGDIPELLGAIRDSGAEPALAFNVGSGVTSPDGYRHAMQVARKALEKSTVAVRLLDVGGGFPRSYPGFSVPPLHDFFSAIQDEAPRMPLAADGELLAEPGRALAAPGLSVVTQVLLKHDERIYLNDGMYGSFWELRFKGHKHYPLRVFRDGEVYSGTTKNYRVFGPTCDSFDVLPEPVALPQDIAPGDHIEFGSIGAYSISGRTRFNGFDAGPTVTINSAGALPPG